MQLSSLITSASFVEPTSSFAAPLSFRAFKDPKAASPASLKQGIPKAQSVQPSQFSAGNKKLKKDSMDWDKLAEMSRKREHTMNLDSCAADVAADPSPKLPVLFVSHGSPMSAVQDTPASNFWKLLGKKASKLPGLKSVLIISAHWETPSAIRVNTHPQPPTIHDFYGFPDQLYTLKYPAKGSEELADRAMELLKAAGFPVKPDSKHGFDHGAWVPLRWMFPECDIPVVQMSLLQGVSGETHIRVGEALQKLRSEGVLIVGSGSSTHNLMDLRKYIGTNKVAPYTEVFEEKLEAIACSSDASTRSKKLVDFEEDQVFRQAHPTPEHFYPLNVALGAAGSDLGRKLFEMAEMSIGYTSFSFGAGV